MIKSPNNSTAIWKQFGVVPNPGTKLVPKFTDKTLRHKRANNIGFHPGCAITTTVSAKNPFSTSRYKDYRTKIMVAYCVHFPADANNGTTRYILNLTVYRLRNNILQRATRISGLHLALFTAAWRISRRVVYKNPWINNITPFKTFQLWRKTLTLVHAARTNYQRKILFYRWVEKSLPNHCVYRTVL